MLIQRPIEALLGLGQALRIQPHTIKAHPNVHWKHSTLPRESWGLHLPPHKETQFPAPSMNCRGGEAAQRQIACLACRRPQGCLLFGWSRSRWCESPLPFCKARDSLGEMGKSWGSSAEASYVSIATKAVLFNCLYNLYPASSEQMLCSPTGCFVTTEQ